MKFVEAIENAFVVVQSFADMDPVHTADIGVLYEEDNACPVDQELYTMAVFLVAVQSNLDQGSLYLHLVEDLEAFAFVEVAYVVLVELIVEQVQVVVQN